MDFGGGIRKNAGVGKTDRNKKHIKMEELDRKKNRLKPNTEELQLRA